MNDDDTLPRVWSLVMNDDDTLCWQARRQLHRACARPKTPSWSCRSVVYAHFDLMPILTKTFINTIYV